jgi:hypothetical protein
MWKERDLSSLDVLSRYFPARVKEKPQKICSHDNSSVMPDSSNLLLKDS